MQGSYFTSSKDGFPGISADWPPSNRFHGDRRPSVPRDRRCGGSSTLVWSATERWDDGTGRLLIEQSKTDQTGEGEVVFITRRAMTALDELRQLRGDASSSVFGMEDKTVNHRVRATAAGLGEGFSGHSGGVGLARRMARAGATDSAIMRQGRWFSNTMAAKYTRGEAARWAADVAKRIGDTRLRLLCAPLRIYLGDCPGEPGPHGQNWRLSGAELCIANRPDNLLGTHPINWFPARSIHARLARLPNSDSISPLNWFSLRFSLVTRPLLSVVTPIHSLIGASLDQLSFIFQSGPPVAL